MARTRKDTVDYFPHDAHASAESATLAVLEGQFNNDGYAFWFKLLETLGCSNGHFLDWSDPRRLQVFCGKSHITEKQGVEMLNLLVEMHAIDKELWDKNRIIWCQNLVDNLSDVYQNRKRAIPLKPNGIKLLTTGSNDITTVRNCITCGGLLEGLRVDAKYCSDNCRLKGFRETDNETDNSQSTPDNAITTPSNSITTPDIVIPTSERKGKERKGKEIRGEEISSLSSEEKLQGTNLDSVLDAFRENIGEPSEDEEKDIVAAVEQLSAEWVIDAIKLAVARGKKRWPYVGGILQNWRRWGRQAGKPKRVSGRRHPVKGQYDEVLKFHQERANQSKEEHGEAKDIK